MCDYAGQPGGREAAMVVVKRDATGKPTVWCDPCIADVVSALNAAGLQTVASCCGHGRVAGNIFLADGRVLRVQSREYFEHLGTWRYSPPIHAAGQPPLDTHPDAINRAVSEQTERPEGGTDPEGDTR